MAKKKTKPERVEMMSSRKARAAYGSIARPLADDVAVWEAAGWVVVPQPTEEPEQPE